MVVTCGVSALVVSMYVVKLVKPRSFLFHLTRPDSIYNLL